MVYHQNFSSFEELTHKVLELQSADWYMAMLSHIKWSGVNDKEDTVTYQVSY